ncbi:MAG: MFS transporter [Proteobacteria bacterium]|nr:MFS transporter [Pseudomonadota bacterium]
MLQKGHSTTPVWNSLKQPFFRMLWITNVVSLIGTWMHEVGASWLMTTIAPSPFMVAMVQTATTLPFFLLSLPAGALADIFDRRRLLIIAQIWMLCVSVCLGITTVFGLTTPLILLFFTFFLSLGAAINAPAWQAIIPEIVHRDDLPSAITLTSAGFNIARVAGPTLGGIVIAAIGTGATFLLNGASFLGVIIVLKGWKREYKKNTLPEERLIGAIKTGIRYVRNAPQVRAVLIHSIFFSIFSSSLWAFLPIIARKDLGLSSLGYGILMGLFGIGGLSGAALLNLLRNKISLNLLVLTAKIIFALAIISLAYVKSFILLGITMAAGGITWLILLSVFNTVVQSVIPSWVRGRVLSVYLLIFFGGMATGSALCGSMATIGGIPWALTIISLCLIISAIFTLRFKLTSGEGLDLTPSQHWPVLTVSNEPETDEGPVLIIVEYCVEPSQSKEFIQAMKALKTIRRRDGAIKWNLFHEIANPKNYTESFIVESWGEHMRQHERMTVSDHAIWNLARSFHAGSEPQIVKHFIAEDITD